MTESVLQQEMTQEQGYVTRLYEALDRARDRAAAELRQVHGGPTTGTDQAATERDSFARTYGARTQQLMSVERGLAFGRLDQVDGDRFYVGRLGLFDDDHDPLLVDWRAPVAQPFYRATAAHPLGLVRRRHLRLAGRSVVGLDDDVLELTALDEAERHALVGEASLLASLAASRTGRMSEIVATIQAEQDAVIRADLPGVLVVQGGPGTGKTVVALHRAAYLLYTHREQLARRGVLVVGPNPTFLRYIEQVLPSLGETEVVLSTVGQLLPGVVGGAPEPAEASRVKGDLRMVAVVARAVASLPRGRARRDLTPEHLLTLLWSSPERLAAAAPELSTAEREALRRPAGEPWSRADVALLDEAAELIGETEGARRQRRQADAARAAAHAEHLAYTREVVHSQLAADQLTIDPLDVAPFIELMAERTEHREAAGTIAERAAADRTWQFGHVIVDEAQELSPMEWRMLVRRCRRRSMTLVGDLAQSGTDSGVQSWAELLEQHAPGRWRVAELTVSYRTPAEIMAVAADVLAVVDPAAVPPVSARWTGSVPWGRSVPSEQFGAALVAAVAEERERTGDGRLAVVVPRSRRAELTALLTAALPGAASGTDPAQLLDASLAVLDVEQSKGLEFDAVVIADPGAILRDSARGGSDLYVALTRPTQRLGVVADGPLPEVLHGLLPGDGTVV
ncbi:Part of AAA domain-containing protein [Friedmanniella luteola]|uniref:Part of AAA domain-containing protein n=1 Tax=Friedmanniella luteola TaxID=546871 RepID=A0A1H1VXJ9_9ACTN|nr:AAA family ATPase [Friedmanniella luteola]SDS89614.1 Part of AAA domain-containing protein [Friedmanniella luteola]